MIRAGSDRSGLAFRLLGRPSAWLDGHELPVPRGQSWLLLAYLLERRGRTVERSDLAAAVWPGEPPAQADVAVRALLSRLRTVLGRELISGRGTAAIEPLEDAWIDVDELRAVHTRARQQQRAGRPEEASRLAAEALEFPDEQFLAGFDAPWIEERRRELDSLREQALTVLARSGLEPNYGSREDGRAAARELAERCPLSEIAAELLIRSELIAGDTPEALLVYDGFRRRLRAELGLAPSQRLRDLHMELIGNAPAEETDDPSRSSEMEQRLRRALQIAGEWHRAPTLEALERRAAESLSELLEFDVTRGGRLDVDPSARAMLVALTASRRRHKFTSEQQQLADLLHPLLMAAHSNLQLRDERRGERQAADGRTNSPVALLSRAA